MGSLPNQNHQPMKEESTHFASGNYNNPQPGPGGYPPPPPAMGYPSAMGYPPAHYLPPPGYHPYAPPPLRAPPYAQPQPSPYYNPTHQSPALQSSSGFVKGVMIGFFLLMIFMFISTLTLWLVLRPKTPVFQVESLSVSSFNASSPSGFTANWDATVIVQNPNTRLSLYLEEIKDFVYYKNDYVGSAFSQPFFMETQSRNTTSAKISANNTGGGMLESWVVDRMAKDRSSGTLSFDFRMVISSTFTAGSWWERHLILKVFCWDIKVAFVGASGNGSSTNGDVRKCIAYG